MDELDCVVLGAGVIGLAVARELAVAGLPPVILDAGSIIGSETSSRNSEVIHAGIYYPKNSLKALSCVEGRDLLYDYCERAGVPHRRCGKLIVASSDAQVADLEGIAAKARANGVDDLQFLTAGEALEMEPALRCSGALYSPSTGIIDSHAYMLALQGEAETHGAMTVLHTRILRAERVSDGFVLHLEGGEAIKAKRLVNALGHGACALARSLGAEFERVTPTAYLAKGSYFGLSSPSPFSRLIYPVPEPGGLGVHLTLDLAGRARFGPDVEWTDRFDYEVDPSRADAFVDRIRAYWPDLTPEDLVADYSGIRPKISGPGEAAADFVVQGPGAHGAPGLVNLFGIESPGLTASLSLARRVREALEI